MEISAQRTTPAGLPVVEVLIAHQSTQVEAGIPRNVEVEMRAVGMGIWAQYLVQAPLGSLMTVTGFFTARTQRMRQPVLHLTAIEFLNKTPAKPDISGQAEN